MGKKIDIYSGKKYGMLLPIKDLERKVLPSGQKIRVIECKCDCGNLKPVALVHLVRGRIVSCGCKFRVKAGESNTHLHRKYKSMIERCYESSAGAHNYYLKGISVCKEWLNDYFEFKKWALSNGYDKSLTIDRIDNSKGYYPENCRFVTNLVNVNNRDNTFMVEYNGTKRPFMELVREVGIKTENIHTVRCRIMRGWNHQKAIDTPIKIGNYKRGALK